jgi:hypothetical protein
MNSAFCGGFLSSNHDRRPSREWWNDIALYATSVKSSEAFLRASIPNHPNFLRFCGTVSVLEMYMQQFSTMVWTIPGRGKNSPHRAMSEFTPKRRTLEQPTYSYFSLAYPRAYLVCTRHTTQHFETDLSPPRSMNFSENAN